MTHHDRQDPARTARAVLLRRSGRRRPASSARPTQSDASVPPGRCRRSRSRLAPDVRTLPPGFPVRTPWWLRQGLRRRRRRARSTPAVRGARQAAPPGRGELPAAARAGRRARAAARRAGNPTYAGLGEHAAAMLRLAEEQAAAGHRSGAEDGRGDRASHTHARGAALKADAREGSRRHPHRPAAGDRRAPRDRARRGRAGPHARQGRGRGHPGGRASARPTSCGWPPSRRPTPCAPPPSARPSRLARPPTARRRRPAASWPSRRSG